MRLFDTGAAFRAAAAAQVRRDERELFEAAIRRMQQAAVTANRLIDRCGSVIAAHADPGWPYRSFPLLHWWEIYVDRFLRAGGVVAAERVRL